MSLPLLTTKLCIPHTLVTLVGRPRLFEKLSRGLEHAARRMLVSAPERWSHSNRMEYHD